MVQLFAASFNYCFGLEVRICGFGYGSGLLSQLAWAVSPCVLPHPFLVLASLLQKSILLSGCFLLSCWHLFLALPLLYLYPLIVITACKEARIGEINKIKKKKKVIT